MMDTRGISKILKLDIKTKTILRFFILTILVTQALNSFGQSNATVRFDGLYQTVSEIDIIHYASQQTIARNSTTIIKRDILEGIQREYEKEEKVFTE